MADKSELSEAINKATALFFLGRWVRGKCGTQAPSSRQPAGSSGSLEVAVALDARPDYGVPVGQVHDFTSAKYI